MATGDYLYWGSADDMVLPGFFESAMNLLEQYPTAPLCASVPIQLREETAEQFQSGGGMPGRPVGGGMPGRPAAGGIPGRPAAGGKPGIGPPTPGRPGIGPPTPGRPGIGPPTPGNPPAAWPPLPPGSAMLSAPSAFLAIVAIEITEPLWNITFAPSGVTFK